MSDSFIRVGVVGSAGYTGGELIRLLVNHPSVKIVFLHSQSNAGKPVSDLHTDLLGTINLYFTNELSNQVDVIFLCLGHSEAKVFLESNNIPSSVKIIDLSQDFRIFSKFQNRQFVYGLPELNYEKIKIAKNIANPGCFATAIQLGLLPMLKQYPLNEIHSVGITGSTGAGQSFQKTSHFSWRANNISAYKTLSHQHLNEINQTFRLFSQNEKTTLQFIPWRGDFSRGIFVSSIFKAPFKLQEVKDFYIEFYKMAKFTHLMNGTLDLKQVINTNNCFIQIEQEGSTFVVHSAIDNLLKGASGQALQNMNIMFGIDEKSGLQLKNIAF